MLTAIVCTRALANGSRRQYFMEMNEKVKNYYKEKREIYAGTWYSSKGMYLGVQNDPSCKENRNILITTYQSQNWNDTVIVQDGFYKRNYKGHKKGDKKFKKYLKRYAAFDIDEASKIAFDYPTHGYGLTKFRRDIIVIDSDVEYESLEEADKMIAKFEAYANVPRRSYIIRNPKTKHCQFGWYMKKDAPFYGKGDKRDSFPEFNAIIKLFAKLYSECTGYEGDIRFNGPACKNPYYEGFESIIDASNKYESKDFISILNRLNRICIYKPSLSSSYNNTVVTLKEEIKTKTSKSGSKRHYFGDTSSRDYLETKALREWIWSYMRNHNDEAPDYNVARKQYDIFAEEAGKVTGKGKHSSSELNSTFKCTYNWSVSKFKRIDSDKSKQKEGAAFGRFIQKLQSYTLDYYIWQEKGSTREIAKKIGCSNATVCRANKIKGDNEQLGIILEDIERFIDYINKYSDSIDVTYTSLRNTLECVKVYILNLFLSSSYNNTVVTLDKKEEALVEEYIAKQDKELKNLIDLKNSTERLSTETISWLKWRRTNLGKSYEEYLKETA